MKEDMGFMELDLGGAEPGSTFSFDRTFDLPSPEGGTAACDATVSGTITKSANRYIVEAHVSATVRADCHRCLAPFALPVDTTFTVILNRGEPGVPPDGVEEEDDTVSIPVSGEATFDLFPRVREAIILEIPIKLLCREDCKGVCAKCGANLNEGECGCDRAAGDPRWGTLKKFLNGEDKT